MKHASASQGASRSSVQASSDLTCQLEIPGCIVIPDCYKFGKDKQDPETNSLCPMRCTHVGHCRERPSPGLLMQVAQKSPVQPGYEHAEYHCQEDGSKDDIVEVRGVMLQ